MTKQEFRKMMIPKMYLFLAKVSKRYKVEVDYDKEEISIINEGNEKKFIKPSTEIIDFDGKLHLATSENYSYAMLYRKNGSVYKIIENEFAAGLCITTHIHEEGNCREVVTVNGRFESERVWSK